MYAREICTKERLLLRTSLFSLVETGHTPRLKDCLQSLGNEILTEKWAELKEMKKIMQQRWGAWTGELKVLSTPSDSPSEGLWRRAIKLRPFPKPLTVQWDGVRGEGWVPQTLSFILWCFPPYLSSTEGKRGHGVHDRMWNLGAVKHVVDIGRSLKPASSSPAWAHGESSVSKTKGNFCREKL